VGRAYRFPTPEPTPAARSGPESTPAGDPPPIRRGRGFRGVTADTLRFRWEGRLVAASEEAVRRLVKITWSFIADCIQA